MACDFCYTGGKRKKTRENRVKRIEKESRSCISNLDILFSSMKGSSPKLVGF